MRSLREPQLKQPNVLARLFPPGESGMMKSLLFVLAVSIASVAAAAEPIAFGDGSQTALAVNQRFAAAMAVRYPQGADFLQARADAEANGLRCEAMPGTPGVQASECVRSVRVSNCNREWAVELRQADGKLASPAVGSFATLCVGAILPAKRSGAYQSKPKQP
jgi:hypothetical protein